MKKKYYFGIFLFFVLVLSLQLFPSAPTAHADEAFYENPFALTAEKAVELALQQNLDFRKSGMDVQAAGRRHTHRGAAFLPSLTASGGVSYGPVDQRTGSPWGGSASVTLSVSLNAGQLSSIRDTVLAFQQGTISYELAGARLERDVLKSFYRLLVREERERLIEQDIASVRSRYDAAQFDYERGRISEYELLSARLSLMTRLPDLEDSRITTKTEREQFSRLLGLPQGAEFVLSGSIETDRTGHDGFKLTEALNAARGHGSVRILETGVVQRELSLRRLYDDYFPRAVIGISSGFRVLPDFETYEFPRGGVSGNYASLSISVNLSDFLPFSAQREKVTAAQEALAKSRLDLAAGKRQIEADISVLLDRLEKAARDIEIFQFNLELSEEFYRIGRTEYESGRQDLLVLEDADLRRQRARVDLLSRKQTYLELLLDLEYYTGEHLRRSGE